MSSTINRISDIIDNLQRVTLLVHGHSKKAKKETGLTGPQLWAVKVIADAAPIRVSDIASRMYLHPATVGGILDRLEARNIVARNRSMTDRRVVYVSLTEQGLELVTKAPEATQELLVKGLEVLTDKESCLIAEAMEHLVGILGVENMAPQLLHKERGRKQVAVKENPNE